MLFSFLLLTLAASVMQWSLTERRMNARSGYWLEARNAAEAVAEYGCFQVAQAFNQKMNPTFGTDTGQTPITLPPSDFFSTTGQAGGHVSTTSFDLRAGTVTKVPATSLYFVDPADPNNRFDPLVGRYVFRRDVTVLSSATVTPAAGGGPPITAYIEEKVSIRGAPLFAYAIFYSGNDLEFGESPKMDIYGPVHVNGNLFVGPVGSAALSFHGPVSASGNVYHAWRGTTAVAQEGSNTIIATTPVNFSTDGTYTGPTINMRTAGGIWNDSTMGADSSTSGLASLIALVTPARTAAFSQYASQTWKGNLQTAAMGVQDYNPMGFTEVVAEDSVTHAPILASNPLADEGTVVGTGAGYGHGYGPHSLVEPARPLVASTDPFKAAKDAIEEQKFANKAGLYIKVVVTPVAGSPDAMVPYVYGDPHTGTGAGTDGPNGGKLLGTLPSNVVQLIPYTTSGTGTSTVVTKGMYDQHQDKGVNLVQINLQALKTALTNMTTAAAPVAGTDIVAADGTKWGVGTASLGYDKYVPASTGWNGGIFVDVTSTSANHTGVILANGRVASGSTLTPTGASAPNGIEGLTVATNAPAYILGHFNADGTVAGTAATNNSALYPDDYPGTAITSSIEAPVAIAADAVTVLSPNYFGTAATTNLAPTAAMSSGNAYNSFKTNAPSASGSVEIAAAIIAGTVTTSQDSSGTQQYSGGVHNFPRFLENWGSNTVAIRGAMVSMFSSRIATVGWSQSYYSAPVRQWGFDQIFANGKFPPVCPTVITYRRVDFTYVPNAAAYATELSHL